jgi:quinoprotein relay system zinc metallohydrolase 2
VPKLGRTSVVAWISSYILACMALLIALPSQANRPIFNIKEVAPGVFVHQGEIEPMSRRNLGDIANVGFIVGDDCVAVIDTGGSPPVGRSLAASIRAHTDRPVCYVINTHAHPDHVFGNSAFTAQDPIVIAHENFTTALGARMQTYLDRFSRIYDRRLSADVIVPPKRTIADTTTLDLGGRKLKLTALPTGHTNNDLIVFDASTRTLWTGDALFVRHIPVLDGSIVGWFDVMDRLEDIKAVRAIPGHGPHSVSWPQGLAPQRRYLETVASGVRRIIDEDGTIEDAIASVGYAARDRWLLFEEYHRRNVTAAFAELEWE